MIPKKLTQELEIQKSDFAEFKPSKAYDYIFATQSLMYTLIDYESLDDETETRKKGTSLKSYGTIAWPVCLANKLS
jgi:hypothetical protein